MVTPVSLVRRVRVPVFDTPRDAEPHTPAQTVPTGPRTMAVSEGGLAALRRPMSLGSSLSSAAVSAPTAVAPLPARADLEPAPRESLWRARAPLPMQRPEATPPMDAMGTVAAGDASHTQLVAPHHAATGGPDRLALGRAVETLHAFPYVVFDESSLIAQLLPRYTATAPVVSTGLALEWLLAGQALTVQEGRLQRLYDTGVVDALLGHRELMEGLRALGPHPRVGSVLRASDRDLALRLNLLLSTEADVIDTAARQLSDRLRDSEHKFHLLLLTGGLLPRPVACIREADEQFSLFDPTRGIFTLAGDDLQPMLAGIAAEHEQRLLHQRERGDMRQALSILHNAQLMEVAMHGVDIDHDGIRDGGLI
jgi:hypothetical protein